MKTVEVQSERVCIVTKTVKTVEVQSERVFKTIAWEEFMAGIRFKLIYKIWNGLHSGGSRANGKPHKLEA